MDIEERVSELEQVMVKISEIIDKITRTYDKDQNEMIKTILLLADKIDIVNSRVEELTKKTTLYVRSGKPTQVYGGLQITSAQDE